MKYEEESREEEGGEKERGRGGCGGWPSCGCRGSRGEQREREEVEARRGAARNVSLRVVCSLSLSHARQASSPCRQVQADCIDDGGEEEARAGARYVLRGGREGRWDQA